MSHTCCSPPRPRKLNVANQSLVRKLGAFHLIPSQISELAPRMSLRANSISAFNGCSSSRKNALTVASVCEPPELRFVGESLRVFTRVFVSFMVSRLIAFQIVQRRVFGC